MMVEQIVQHFDSSGDALDTPITVSYLQGPKGPLYRKSSAEANPSWYVYDGLGSAVGEVDVNGNLTATKEFDVYGATRSYTGNPTTRQGFVGGLSHETDDETGLVYMRARYYDPECGRFVSQDPALHGSNWFIYCDDNPINETDQSGKYGAGVNALLNEITNDNAYTCATIDCGISLTTGLIAFRDPDPVSGACLGALSVGYGCLAVYAFAISLGALPQQARDAALGAGTAALVIALVTGASGAGAVMGSAGAGLAAGAVGAAFFYSLDVIGAMIQDD